MLLLTSTSDIIQVITGSALSLGVHASWVDNNAGTITPGRTNTPISTATTTTVVAAPASGAQRNVKTLNIRNSDASSSNAVTVQHYDGTNTVVLCKVTLGAGEELVWTEGVGWEYLAANGALQVTNIAQSSKAGSSASPTGGVSTTEKAMGLGLLSGFQFTPSKTGNLLIWIGGVALNSTAAGDGTTITGRYGTGTGPSNGATSGLGTSFGLPQHFVASTTAGQQGFIVMDKLTGLTVGTTYWFDLSLLAVTGGGSTVKDVQIIILEVA